MSEKIEPFGEELNYILPKDTDYEDIKELNNHILDLNDLNHWECLSKDSFERVDGKYFNMEFSNRYFEGGVSSNFVILLKEYDKMFPIDEEPVDCYA